MILILTQCFPPTSGGIETFMGNLAHTLTAANEEVLVLADGQVQESDTSFPFKVRRFSGIKFWRRKYKAWVANRYLKTENITHIFCDSWKSVEYLKPTDNKPITVFAHGSEYPQSSSAKKRRRIIKALQKSNKVLAVSKFTQQRVQNLGFDSQALSVWKTPTAVPSSFSSSDKNKVNHWWKSGDPKFLTVSRLVERKGIDTSIRALGKMIATYPHLRYLIVGEGILTSRLQHLIDEYGWQQQIQLLGRISNDEKNALYASADFFILLPQAVGDDVEGLGIVFLEAAYFGLPSIVGDVGGGIEAVEDGITGIHVDSQNPNLDKVKNSLEHSDLYQKMSQQARDSAHQNLWQQRVGELLKDD